MSYNRLDTRAGGEKNKTADIFPARLADNQLGNGRRRQDFMSELKAMKSVYCYFFPETRDLMRYMESALPDKMYLVTTPVEMVREHLEPLFSPPLDVPQTPQCYVNLDEIHVPIIERVVRAYYPLAPALGGFEHRYPTPGSSEGIFKILTKLRCEGVDTINVLPGEYEGYEEYAGPSDLGMRVNKVDPEKAVAGKIEPGVWFISNPSARDGNILPDQLVQDLCNKGNRVVLDLSYIGATKPHKFDLSHENIPAVFMSLSKPYGLFRFRIGFTFSRAPVHSLYGNKWFKDPARLLQGLRVIEELGPDEQGSTNLYKRYRPVQEQVVAGINSDLGLGMRTSDSLLLGHITGEDAEKLGERQLPMIAQFARGSGYRFCLTPYFEEWERNKRKQ
jgi:hypothetical protein